MVPENNPKRRSQQCFVHRFGLDVGYFKFETKLQLTLLVFYKYCKRVLRPILYTCGTTVLDIAQNDSCKAILWAKCGKKAVQVSAVYFPDTAHSKDF